MEQSKKAKLIVLIMIGVCAILLFVCLFTIISFNRKDSSAPANSSNTSKEQNVATNVSNEVNKGKTSNSTKKNNVKNKTKDNNVVNKVEIVDTKESEQEGKTEKTINENEMLSNWLGEDAVYETVDVDSYGKEVEKHRLEDSENGFVVEYSLPTDFPLKSYEEYSPLSSMTFFMSEDETVALMLTVSYIEVKSEGFPERENFDEELHSDFRKVKINNLSGCEAYAEYDGKDYYEGEWFIPEPDQDGKYLFLRTTVMKDFDSPVDIDVKEFTTSEDFRFILASINATKTKE